MSSSKSPCAACKFLRRKCTQECVFAPYFPPDQPQKFAKVHKVFGASNVSKLLNELSVNHREDAVNSLEYEAETRLHDPVYGCVGLISLLQARLKHVQQDLFNAKKELANYIGHQAMLPLLPQPGMMHHHHHHHQQYNMQIQQQMMGMQPGGGDMVVQHQQAVEAHQMAVIAAREHQHHQQQQQHHQQQQQQQQTEILRTYDFNGGFDNGTVINSESNGYNQMSGVSMSASLALGSYNDNGYGGGGGGGGGGGQIHQQTHHDDNDLQIQIQPQIMIQQQMVDQKPPRDGSEDGGQAC